MHTKIYLGGEPELIVGDVFRTVVAIGLSDTTMSDNGNTDDKLYNDLDCVFTWLFEIAYTNGCVVPGFLEVAFSVC